MRQGVTDDTHVEVDVGAELLERVLKRGLDVVVHGAGQLGWVAGQQEARLAHACGDALVMKSCSRGMSVLRTPSPMAASVL